MPPTQMISRKEAASRLKISVRTLDRYIRRGCFDVKRTNRSVWISQPSFERYNKDQVKPQTDAVTSEEAETVKEALREAGYQEKPEESELVHTIIDERPEPVKLSAHKHDYDLSSTGIFKQLYEELKDKHDEQVKRLEGAHYRVGQLEAQVKSMVPMIEFKKERKRLLLMDQQYKDKLKTANLKVKKTTRLFETERLNKNVYVAIVYGLLGLQPILWILMQG